MASHSMSRTNVLMLVLLLTAFSSLQHFSVSSFEFEVGDARGWVVPPANDTKFYNDWASDNRFQVGDTVRFKYRKDSVMEVAEEDYKRCNSTHPNFFSNTGNTVFKLDDAGPFYFISGVSGHCERGQQMIIKLLTPEHTLSSRSSSHAAVLSFGVSKLVLVQLVLSCLASFFF